jgi:hypothetical protein
LIAALEKSAGSNFTLVACKRESFKRAAQSQVTPSDSDLKLPQTFALLATSKNARESAKAATCARFAPSMRNRRRPSAAAGIAALRNRMMRCAPASASRLFTNHRTKRLVQSLQPQSRSLCLEKSREHAMLHVKHWHVLMNDRLVPARMRRLASRRVVPVQIETQDQRIRRSGVGRDRGDVQEKSPSAPPGSKEESTAVRMDRVGCN